MNILMTLAGPSTRASSYVDVCSGHERGLRPSHGELGRTETPSASTPFAGQWFGNQRPTVRPRPDAVSILDPHTVSAPLGWSP